MDTYRLRFPLWFLEFPPGRPERACVKYVVHVEAGGNRSGLLFAREASAQAFRDARPQLTHYAPAAIGHPAGLFAFLDVLEGAGFRHVALDTGRRVMAYAVTDLRAHVRAATGNAGGVGAPRPR